MSRGRPTGESELTFLRALLDELGGAVSSGTRSPVALFRSVIATGVPVHDGRPLVEVVGLPSRPPSVALRAGDWMVRATPGTGDLGHVSVLASSELLSHAALATNGIAAESSLPGQYGVVIEAGAFPRDSARPFARRLLDERGRVLLYTLFLRPVSSLSPPDTEEPERDQIEWRTFGVADDSPVPTEIAEFARTLGSEWSARRNGSPPVDQMTNWLLEDYRNTLQGAHHRFGSRVGDEVVGRAWMISRREQMGFQMASNAGIGELSNFQPPSEAVSLVTDAALIEGSDRAPVAPLVIRFVQELRQRYSGHLHVSTYRGHGGGAFLDRGYSIDLFLNGSDSRRFYPPETAIRFLRAVHETAGATDTEWRIIYNDFTVAEAINRETGRRHLIFVGSPTFDRNRNVTGLNWHGPEPLILHLHLDLVPRSGGSASTPPAPGVSAATAGTPAGAVLGAPAPELVTFAQTVLRAAEGEQLSVDGVLGPLTRAAVERFRRKYTLGPGGLLDDRTQLALAQRALEEVRQQSLFGQPGVLDTATREALLAFKAAHGLAIDPLLDASTRSALVRLVRTLAVRPVGGSRGARATEWAEDVPVPSSGRPPSLSRGATHPAVGEAQRKLNALHRYRLAAGLSGLREAPVGEDEEFGRRTFEAVKSFQELVFPGEPAAHSGRIDPRTWEQLDATELRPGSPAVAQVTVDQLLITNDRFGVPLRWDDVIGLLSEKLNLQVVAQGLPPAVMPAQVRVELTSRLPNHGSGSPSLSAPVLLDLARFGPDATNPRRIVYRSGRPLGDVGQFLHVGGPTRKFATVVRIGGTSDVEFSRALGWQSHGSARQPTAPSASSGSESTEIPDAKALFLAAGVEVLQVSVASLPNWRVPGPVSRLVRSPANVLYYSGHGRSSGMLALELEPRECPDVGPLADWLGPAELLAAWPYQLDLDALILAGCSVLEMNVGVFSGRAKGGPGRAWSRLLTAKGGPLRALLGYGGKAPCDSRGGNLIARAMAERLVAGSTNFVQDWLQANAHYRAWNAVAMDNQGYWTIDRRYPMGPAPID